MTLRIDISSLGDDVRRSLAAGEVVDVTDGSAVVGRLAPCESAPPKTWAAFLEARRSDPPLDYDDFLRDLAEIRADLNKPVDESRWAL